MKEKIEKLLALKRMPVMSLDLDAAEAYLWLQRNQSEKIHLDNGGIMSASDILKLVADYEEERQQKALKDTRKELETNLLPVLTRIKGVVNKIPSFLIPSDAKPFIEKTEQELFNEGWKGIKTIMRKHHVFE